MIRIIVLFVFLSFCRDVSASSPLEEFLKSNPEVAAEKAFKSGDKRYLVLPVCGGDQVLPGWPLKETPDFWKALETGKQPLACNDYGDGNGRKNFIAASNHAARYNSKLLQLEGKPTQ